MKVYQVEKESMWERMEREDRERRERDRQEREIRDLINRINTAQAYKDKAGEVVALTEFAEKYPLTYMIYAQAHPSEVVVKIEELAKKVPMKERIVEPWKARLIEKLAPERKETEKERAIRRMELEAKKKELEAKKKEEKKPPVEADKKAEEKLAELRRIPHVEKPEPKPEEEERRLLKKVHPEPFTPKELEARIALEKAMEKKPKQKKSRNGQEED